MPAPRPTGAGRVNRGPHKPHDHRPATSRLTPITSVPWEQHRTMHPPPDYPPTPNASTWRQRRRERLAKGTTR